MTQPMKSHGLFVYYTSPQLLFPLCKRVLSIFVDPLAHGPPWLHTVNCNSLLIPNKPIFAGEITSSLFVLGQQSIAPFMFIFKKSNTAIFMLYKINAKIPALQITSQLYFHDIMNSVT